MGFFDNFKEKATDLVQAGAAQSKRLAEIAKLKTANMAEEDTIKKAYIELGKLYYAEKGTTPDAAYAASCEKITAARAAIETNNDRIAELKEKESDEDLDFETETEVEAAAEEAAPAEDDVLESDLEPETEEPAPAQEVPAEEPAQETQE